MIEDSVHLFSSLSTHTESGSIFIHSFLLDQGPIYWVSPKSPANQDLATGATDCSPQGLHQLEVGTERRQAQASAGQEGLMGCKTYLTSLLCILTCTGTGAESGHGGGYCNSNQAAVPAGYV